MKSTYFAFIAIALLILCSHSHAARPPTPVIVKAVQLEPFAETIEALGTLRANEAVTLSATVTQTVSAIHFEDTQRVKAGEVLIEMTRTEEQAQLEEARSALHEAQRQFERVQSLVTSGLASESLLDQRRLAFESAQAKLAAIQSRLKDRLIIAPFDGVVGLRNISVGSLVRPGDPITTLDDDSVMKLDISLPAVFLDSVRPGLSIKARTRDLGDTIFDGTVSSIASRVDPVTRSVVVRARVPNPERKLRPGMLMTVLVEKPAEASLMLPEEALIQEGSRQFVYVADPRQQPVTAAKRAITIGARRPGEVVVTSGLEPGEWVVTHGVMKLNDGSTVEITATQQGNEPLTELLQPKGSAKTNTESTPKGTD